MESSCLLKARGDSNRDLEYQRLCGFARRGTEKSQDLTIFLAGLVWAGSRYLYLHGISVGGIGILFFSRTRFGPERNMIISGDHGVVPSPVNARGKRPEDCPGDTQPVLLFTGRLRKPPKAPASFLLNLSYLYEYATARRETGCPSPSLTPSSHLHLLNPEGATCCPVSATRTPCSLCARTMPAPSIYRIFPRLYGTLVGTSNAVAATSAGRQGAR